MAAITAKVTCNGKQPYADQATITFMPNYQDGRNAEWAQATPHLDLRMTVKGDVADQFEPGVSYTLTFERDTE